MSAWWKVDLGADQQVFVFSRLCLVVSYLANPVLSLT